MIRNIVLLSLCTILFSHVINYVGKDESIHIILLGTIGIFVSSGFAPTIIRLFQKDVQQSYNETKSLTGTMVVLTAFVFVAILARPLLNSEYSYLFQDYGVFSVLMFIPFVYFFKLSNLTIIAIAVMFVCLSSIYYVFNLYDVASMHIEVAYLLLGFTVLKQILESFRQPIHEN